MGGVENPSPAIYQLRKGSLSRDAVSRLWSCCRVKEKRGGGKKKERTAKRDERGGKQEAGLQGWWFEKRLSI